MKKITLSIFLIMCCLYSFSQGYSVRLTERRGTGGVVFEYSTLTRINNGVAYNSYSEIQVEFVDSAGLSLLVDGFALYVRSALPEFEAGYGGPPLQLDKMEITAVATNGLVSGTAPELSFAENPICYWPVTDNNVETVIRETATISYVLGDLANRNSDFFSTMLVFELKAYVGTP